MMKDEGKENDRKPNPEMVFMDRCLVGCKVIKKNDSKPNPEMVSMERCLVGCKVIKKK